MPKAKLTKRIVEAARPGDKDIILWDTDLTGFGCKVTPKGRRVYFVYYRTREGQQRRPTIGRHGAITCEQARDIARQWLAGAATGGDISAQRQAKKGAPTVAQLCERYLKEHAEPHKKPRSVAEDRRLIEKRIIPRLGRKKAHAVTRADVLALHHALRATPYEANRTLALLSKLFNLAEAWGIRPDGSNPCRHVKRFREMKRERFLSPTELARLGDTLVEAERDGTEAVSVVAALRLLIFTGCRLSEILQLQWADIDEEQGLIHFPETKTGSRVLPLTPPVREVLASLSRHDDNAFVLPALNLVGELIDNGTEPNPAAVEQVRAGLTECVQRDDQGRLQIRLTLPNENTLDDLAKSLAKLLVSVCPETVKPRNRRVFCEKAPRRMKPFCVWRVLNAGQSTKQEVIFKERMDAKALLDTDAI